MNIANMILQNTGDNFRVRVALMDGIIISHTSELIPYSLTDYLQKNVKSITVGHKSVRSVL